MLARCLRKRPRKPRLPRPTKPGKGERPLLCASILAASARPAACRLLPSLTPATPTLPLTSLPHPPPSALWPQRHKPTGRERAQREAAPREPQLILSPPPPPPPPWGGFAVLWWASGAERGQAGGPLRGSGGPLFGGATNPGQPLPLPLPLPP
ncbi:WAS/WASL-interacting protein family member 3-like [Schistocerca nitens]|uniref:WAS/WASL-interacting protein family member 3-like n=1 Tax=Schistocerca nitens TaxID=7011 RepID=UPI00211757BC|nr:WAS/WASL-interacting protein family member 3-like [Schistocerca nitens]